MKRHLTTEYQNRLWLAIKAIEQGSQAEAVVVFRAHSANYDEVPLFWGLGAAWLSFTLLMYAPVYFENWLVYYLPMLAFALCYALGSLPAVKRLSIAAARRERQVEIMARAIFQKGGIQHTSGKTGLLIYCSLLERRVLLLADRGLQLAVPQAVWQELAAEFNAIFKQGDPEAALLAALEKTATLFHRFLPARDDDINELPDIMEIEL